MEQSSGRGRIRLVGLRLLEQMATACISGCFRSLQTDSERVWARRLFMRPRSFLRDKGFLQLNCGSLMSGKNFPVMYSRFGFVETGTGPRFRRKSRLLYLSFHYDEEGAL